jgi:hypothetical protein
MTKQSVSFASHRGPSGLFALFLLASLAWSGCASMDSAISLQTVASMSPAPEVTDLATAARQARVYMSTHPGTQLALGSGDSMLPFYKDNTMILIQKLPMSELKRGMTVVYVSREGWPVAHALVEKTSDGWVTAGLDNPDCDSETTGRANYVGVVVKAYQIDINPMLALSRALSSDNFSAAKQTPLMAINP